MKITKRVLRFFRISLFAFMLAVCMVLGVAPVIPKRKEQFKIEVKMDENETEKGVQEPLHLFKADNQ